MDIINKDDIINQINQAINYWLVDSVNQIPFYMHICLTAHCSSCSVVLSYNDMTLRCPVKHNPWHRSLFNFCIFSETKLLQCWHPHITTDKVHHWKRIWIWTRQIWLTALCNGCPCLRVIGFVLQVLRRSDLFVQLWASLLHVLQCWLLESHNTEFFTTGLCGIFWSHVSHIVHIYFHVSLHNILLYPLIILFIYVTI